MIFSRASFACARARAMIGNSMPLTLMSICRAVTPSWLPATLKSMSPRWSSSPAMSVSTAMSSAPSPLISPIAMPAIGFLIGTPASIIESTAAQTLAIEVLPLDDSTSETMRIV